MKKKILIVDDFLAGTARQFPTNILRALSFTALPEKCV